MNFPIVFPLRPLPGEESWDVTEGIVDTHLQAFHDPFLSQRNKVLASDIHASWNLTPLPGIFHDPWTDDANVTMASAHVVGTLDCENEVPRVRLILNRLKSNLAEVGLQCPTLDLLPEKLLRLFLIRVRDHEIVDLVCHARPLLFRIVEVIATHFLRDFVAGDIAIGCDNLAVFHNRCISRVIVGG